MNRHDFTPSDTVSYVWTSLGLPKDVLKSLHLPIDAEIYPSSFKVAHLAQASIGLSALSAALVWSVQNEKPVPHVSVPTEHACAEFKSERLYVLNGKSAPSSFGTIGGLHKTRDGYIRMHDGFPNHRKNALEILGLDLGATRDDVARKMLQWNSVDLETEAIEKGAVMAALRSFKQWDATIQARSIADVPIILSKVAEGRVLAYNKRSKGNSTRCLRGIRVVELSRVIAAPVAGRTLAAHGADVLWITSPSLPDLSELDVDVSRGKRTAQLTSNNPKTKRSYWNFYAQPTSSYKAIDQVVLLRESIKS